MSVARIDLRASRFEIAADAGAELLAPGTALPLSTCSYFAQVSEGRAFHEDDFDRSRAFDRPVDGVILATGFHSGCSVPLRDGGEVVGALSLSTARRGQAMAEFVIELEPLCDALVAQIDGLRLEAAVRALRSAERARPVDGVILATGFHSGCSVPLRDGGEVVGAISLSTSRRGEPMAELVAELEPLADALVAQIDGLRIEAAVRALRSAERARSVEVLTAREQELLECLEEGLRFKQVAHRLGISQATAKTHARNLFRKLDATSRGEAVHAARVRGLLA